MADRNDQPKRAASRQVRAVVDRIEDNKLQSSWLAKMGRRSWTCPSRCFPKAQATATTCASPSLLIKHQVTRRQPASKNCRTS